MQRIINSTPIIDSSDFKNWIKINKVIDKNNTYQWHNSGAEIISKVCTKMIDTKNRKINILLPGYFCGQTLKYLRSLDIKSYFYSLNKYLKPDMENIRKESMNKKIDLLILVHYFGKKNDFEEIKNFAKKQHIFIIEDCAHLISPLINQNFIGDIVMFSPHKYFPLPKIALSIDRTNYLYKTYYNFLFFNYFWLIKQIIKKIFKIKKKPKWSLKINDLKENIKYKPPNALVINAAKNYIEKYKIYGKIRMNNYVELLKLICRIPYWEPAIKFEKNEIPYIVPMICDKNEIAKKRFYLLNQNFSLVMQWPDIPKELIEKNSRVKFDSIERINRTIFFFVHQKLNSDLWLREISNVLSIKDFI